MNDIEIYRKETPPLTVGDLARELDILAPLVEQWLRCGNEHCSRELFQQVARRLHPHLMKTLVMIAQKQTAAILDARKKTTLTFLGSIAVCGSPDSELKHWTDVFISDDLTPLLRRVSLSPESVEFHAVSWAGCASITCAGCDSWDEDKKNWVWHACEGDAAAPQLHSNVLPRLPLRLDTGASLKVPDWIRHIEYVTPDSLLAALDRTGNCTLDENEKESILALLKNAGANLNPLWSLLREDEWE